MKPLTLHVKAIEIANFGKIEYCYKPECAKGAQLLAMAIACGRKPDSKRTSFSLALANKARELCATTGFALTLEIVEVKALARPKIANIGDNVFSASATPVAQDLDMGFLG